MTDAPYRLILTARARRRLTEPPPAGLPASAAAAAAEFVLGPLLATPHRVGKALLGPYEGHHGARRGEYRVLYVIDDTARSVTVVTVDHRRDAYRRR